jgi:hypothetical protein
LELFDVGLVVLGDPSHGVDDLVFRLFDELRLLLFPQQLGLQPLHVFLALVEVDLELAVVEDELVQVLGEVVDRGLRGLVGGVGVGGEALLAGGYLPQDG